MAPGLYGLYRQAVASDPTENEVAQVIAFTFAFVGVLAIIVIVITSLFQELEESENRSS